ncbi:hypothetical protein M4A92_16780 [Caldibacillus thermoamylovorans]|nr:hypothetical protein [Caldibacillus thermoamylovorans]MCM3800228.1 hypothetical protein [Caldibacillus thermoamylovorans]
MLKQNPSTEGSLEATKKLKIIVNELNALKTKNPGREQQIDEAIKEVTAIQNEIVGSILDPIV